jgi:putative heme-binding domain-containing protein
MLPKFLAVVLGLLAFTAPPIVLQAEDAKPIHALLVCGGCCHDYARQQYILTAGISARANVEWTIVHEGDGSTSHKISIYNDPNWSKGYDVVVHDECCADVKDKDFVENILKPHRAGLPAVNLHCAMHCYRVSFDNFKDWFEFTGLDTRAHGAQLPISLSFIAPDHPITKGMSDWTTIPEELYNNIEIYPHDTALIYGRQGNDNNMIAWVNDYHGTRVFSTTLGHNNDTVNDPRYLDLVTRGLLWSVDKLNAEYLRPARRVLWPSAKSAEKRLAPENLALLKPATASGSQDGHDPAQAVDGDAGTRWCAPDGGNGYWWQVDLQKPEEITGCQIVWEKDGGPYQYKIQGSPDGKSWRTLVAENGGQPRPQVDAHKIAVDKIRYVRITVTHAPDGMWASFWEVQVWGKKMVETTERELDPRLVEVKVPAGFDATYFAGPPDISYPTCLAAAPTGEVFVGVDQNGSIDTQTNRGWVVRCLDTHGDGVADQFNVFARMDSPRGIVFDKNVLYVMHPPVLEAFYDDTGRGVANRSEVLVRGLGHDLHFRGADHTCNGVRLGMDGWLYIALGDYGALRAVGKDGKEIQVHGGGIVRVRPDGTGLEIVCQGTRNIYDVAMDPLMDLFTCDNTNDGDDWNVRLSHMIPTARYGYPSLFRHFSDEMIPTMVDYGGGAPTGSIYLDEPGFPVSLYCCQWGWDSVTRHPLQRDGATFKPDKMPFIQLPRPTGIAADGAGNLYVASWKGAVFNYVGPNVGYILRVRPSNCNGPAFPDLKSATDAQLAQDLTTPSAVQRLAIQREILRRGDNSVFRARLEKLAQSGGNLEVRVAAIFTLKQLLGSAADKILLKLAGDDALRPYAIKALTDRKEEASGVSTKILLEYLHDKSPLVRLQAVIGLNRLGRSEAARNILQLTADPDPSVAHVAFRALVDFDAADVCLKALRQNESAVVPGAARVLRNLHEPQVVDGLINELRRKHDAATLHLILQALCRLYYREADYDGSWWGTRPDTSGPYFKPVTWEKSEAIAATLQQQAATVDEATLRGLLADLQLHKIDLPGLGPMLIRAATARPTLRGAVIGVLTGHGPFSREVISFLYKIIVDAKEDPALRVAAFHGLEKAGDQLEVAQSAFDIVDLFGANPVIKPLRSEYINDGRDSRNYDFFIGMTGAGTPSEQELAYAVLLKVVANANSPRLAVNGAQHEIDQGWNGPGLANLLRAIEEDHATNYFDQVAYYATNVNRDIATMATRIAKELEPPAPSAAGEPVNLISKMSYEQASHEAAGMAGDSRRGARLFESLGCVKCHTTAKDQPLKGPFLGDITVRYTPPEIIESILKPSAKIAQGFTTTTVQTRDGTDYDGFVVRESGDTLELRNLSGAVVIPKKDIVTRGTRKNSIMPDGLFDHATPGDLASMLAYLRSLAPR